MKKRIYTAGSILLTAAVMVCSIPVMAQHADNRSFAARTGFLAAKGIVPNAILAAAEAAGKETGGDPDALQ